MPYSRFNKATAAHPPVLRERKEPIGRGALVMVGLTMLLGAWELWGAAQWASEEDRHWNDRMDNHSGNRRNKESNNPYLCGSTLVLFVAGGMTGANATAPTPGTVDRDPPTIQESSWHADAAHHV